MVSRDSRLANAAGLLFTALATFKVLGFLCGVLVLAKIGQTSGIAPAPSPYASFAHSGGWSYGCESANGQIDWHNWDYKVRNAIPGPHRRNVTFLAYFIILSDPAMADLTDLRLVALTQYYYCHGGPLARASGCSDDLAAVVFPIGIAPTGVKRIACPR